MGTRSLQAAKLKLDLSAVVKNTLSSPSTRSASGQVQFNYELNFADGVSSGQANRAWEYTGTITAAGTLLIDLFDLGSLDAGAGAGRDIVGQLLTTEEITTIVIQNTNALGSAGVLQIEPDATNGWSPIGSHTVANGGALRGQGILLKHNPAEEGFDVADASSNEILLTATGGDVDFKILFIGRHDDNESSSSSSSSSQSSSSSSSSSQSSSSSSSQSSSSSSP